MEKRRKTVFSQMVHAGKRTYLVDLDTELSGERIVFLNESHGEGKERHQVLVLRGRHSSRDRGNARCTRVHRKAPTFASARLRAPVPNLVTI